MDKLRLVPPDGADWSIDVRAVTAGVALIIGFELDGKPATLQLVMDRADARALSDRILTAAGDGTMRSFPNPSIEADHA